MQINRKLIERLNPCKDRFVNYVTEYGDREFTIRQFMGLKRITHDDKLWVAVRLLTATQKRLVSADFAELVLPIFESKYLNDQRPRKAIEAVRNLKLSKEKLRISASGANAAYAADAVTYATANAAYYADAYSVQEAATYATSGFPYKKRPQIEKKIRTILIRYLMKGESK